ncbi:hypothetical protein ElyMa_002558600 [Elysia marginata]|uniref:Uncharacterized protein n=1 Tax=Elysia marginata TaxID=1093978 RepID=A0AAV4GW14_9GAST|nr:hypothetical protein ElyMa_002558600 [Elysia marginata]
MADISQFITELENTAPPGEFPTNQQHSQAGKTYYGDAEPEGETILLGGAEVVVGGWAAYEAARRAARWKADPHTAQPLYHYKGRTYITGQDAVESLVVARIGGKSGNQLHDPLVRAAKRLSAALESFEAALAKEGSSSVWARLGLPPDAPVAISTLSAEDLRHTFLETDVYELHRSAEDAGVFASNYARVEELSALRAPTPPKTLPHLSTREEIPTQQPAAYLLEKKKTLEATNRNIISLEAAAVARACAIEVYRGNVAAVFDASAAILERAVQRADAAS